MIVKELIEILGKYDRELPVGVETEEGLFTNVAVDFVHVDDKPALLIYGLPEDENE